MPNFYCGLLQKPETPEVEKPPKFYRFINNRLYRYEKLENSKAYERFPTPTTIDAVADNLNDITEIRYAHDVCYDKLTDPKMIFFRNQDNSCYIIFRIKSDKYCAFYGVHGRYIEIGDNSFSVYELSQDVGSFTDTIPRLIYVDIKGLYFVSSNENPVRDIIDIYQKEGDFRFKGSIICASALDGSITLDGQPVSENNFYENWIIEKKEKETAKSVMDVFGRVSSNNTTSAVKEVKTVFSTVDPKPVEIFRNFYPPEGCYKNIYSTIYFDNRYQKSKSD